MKNRVELLRESIKKKILKVKIVQILISGRGSVMKIERNQLSTDKCDRYRSISMKRLPIQKQDGIQCVMWVVQ